MSENMSPLLSTESALKIGPRAIFDVDETVLKIGINHLDIDRFLKNSALKIAP